MAYIQVKNRYTTVTAAKSIALTEKLLVDAGATNISKFYDNGRVTGFYFSINHNGRPVTFKLPANVDGVLRYFLKNNKVDGPARQKVLKDQAEKTAFKLLYEWVFININIMQMGQAELLNNLLPYAVDDAGKTVYERFTENEIKLLN